MNRFVTFLLLLFVFIVQGSFALAEEPSWQHDVQPYIWFPVSVEGTSTVDGGAAELDLDASDMADMINYAFSLRYEAWKGNFGLIADGMYVDLEADIKESLPSPPFSPGSKLKVEPDIDQVVVDLAGAYRFDHGKLSTDLIGGLRYTYINQELDLSFPAPIPSQDLGGSKDYVEPMIGARLRWILTDKWRATLRGDMSGFGVGSGSDLTWNALAGATYKYSDKTSLKFGYRIYDIDYSNGSGSNEFGVDLKLHGIYLGGSFQF
jgi:opacity protein-like surface antigen